MAFPAESDTAGRRPADSAGVNHGTSSLIQSHPDANLVSISGMEHRSRQQDGDNILSLL